MNQKFTNVIIATANAVIWGVIFEVGAALVLGKLAGWLPLAVMASVFVATLAGLNWLTSETR